jgi:hypothetical protein
MKRLWKCAWLVLPSFAMAGSAAALPVTLTLVPSSVSLMAEQILTLDILVGGLFDSGEIALESFDLDLAFDDTRLQFTSLAFGSSLGDPNDSGETFVTGPGNPNVNGVVEMGMFSLLSGAQLLTLQSAPFVLATIQFEALDNPGSALLELINLAGSSLGAPGGVALGDDLQTPSQLFVSVVPEPGAAALTAVAFALLARRARAARA